MPLLYTAANLIVTVLLSFLPAPAENGYAGSEACATCHDAIYKVQSGSRHAHSWRAPGKEFPASYQVDLDGNEPLPVPVAAILGGDRFGFSFILELDKLGGVSLPRKTLIEGRYLHSVRTGNRVLSPGLPAEKPDSYATAAGRVLSPAFAKKCLGCHGAPSETTPDTGVRCERCHGPGRQHIAAVGAKAKDLAIVHPGKVAAEKLLDICGECHSGFFPLQEPRPEDLLISNQVTALKNSACYIKSNQGITCLTCHNPHANAQHDDAAYERACLSCHAVQARPSKGQGPGARAQKKNETLGPRTAKPCSARNTTGCVTCHMPVTKRTDAFPLVDHWIRAVDRPLPENIRGKITRAVSIAERGDKNEAVRSLESLLASGGGEPSLHYNLGLAYEESNRLEDALRSYEKAIELEPDMVAAHINLGSLLLSQARVDEAIAVFQKAVQINPLEATAHYNMAIAYQHKGDNQRMQRALQLVVAINPRMKRVLAPR
jgi:Tetratricopeptide repeat